jgi:predicted DNA-binding transcriptional regulator YafY
MPATAARLLQLLGLLQRRPMWTGPELADRLGVDARTVRRDVERLRDLGYRVDAAPGVSGGYRLGVGTDLPPLLLDDDEALAVTVVLGISASGAVPGVDRAALATLARIDRLLPPRLRTQLAALRTTTVSLVPPAERLPTEQLVRLAQACDGHERVVFVYRARDGQVSERRVEPHRLVTTDRRWYLVAYDLDRGDWRTFRVDRAETVRLTGHLFEPRPLDDPGRLVAEGISSAPYLYQAVVRIDAPVETVAPRVTPDIGSVSVEDGATILRLGADTLEWLAGRLVGLGVAFEVREPPELRSHLAALGAAVVRSHTGRPEVTGPGARPDRR